MKHFHQIILGWCCALAGCSPSASSDPADPAGTSVSSADPPATAAGAGGVRNDAGRGAAGTVASDVSSARQGGAPPGDDAATTPGDGAMAGVSGAAAGASGAAAGATPMSGAAGQVGGAAAGRGAPPGPGEVEAPPSRAPVLVEDTMVSMIAPSERTVGWSEAPTQLACPATDAFACNGQCISLAPGDIGRWQGTCRTLASDVSVHLTAADATAAYYIDWRAYELRRVTLADAQTQVLATLMDPSMGWMQSDGAQVFYFGHGEGCTTNVEHCLWSVPTAGGAVMRRVPDAYWHTLQSPTTTQLHNGFIYHIAYDAVRQPGAVHYFNEALARSALDTGSTELLVGQEHIKRFSVGEDAVFLTASASEKHWLIASDGSGSGKRFESEAGMTIHEAEFFERGLYLDRFDNGAIAEYGYHYIERYDLDSGTLTPLFAIQFNATLLRASARGLLFVARDDSEPPSDGSASAFGRAPLAGGDLQLVAELGPYRELEALSEDTLYVTVDRPDYLGAIVEVRLADSAPAP
jgi:hypothetical protein